MIRCSLFVLLIAGCGDNSFCVEDQVTITQGVYGLVTSVGDVAPIKPPSHLSNFTLEIRGWPSRLTVASGKSDADGIYQIPLDVGTYAVCYGMRPEDCVVFDLDVDQLVRADRLVAIGGFWSLVIPNECD